MDRREFQGSGFWCRCFIYAGNIQDLEINDEITDMRKVLSFRIPFYVFVWFRLDSLVFCGVEGLVILYTLLWHSGIRENGLMNFISNRPSLSGISAELTWLLGSKLEVASPKASWLDRIKCRSTRKFSDARIIFPMGCLLC